MCGISPILSDWGVQVEEEQAACPSGSVIWNGAPGTSGWVYRGGWCFSCRNKDARGVGLGSSADDTVVLEVEYLTAQHNSGCPVSFSTYAHRLSLFQSLVGLVSLRLEWPLFCPIRKRWGGGRKEKNTMIERSEPFQLLT